MKPELKYPRTPIWVFVLIWTCILAAQFCWHFQQHLIGFIALCVCFAVMLSAAVRQYRREKRWIAAMEEDKRKRRTPISEDEEQRFNS